MTSPLFRSRRLCLPTWPAKRTIQRLRGISTISEGYHTARCASRLCGISMRLPFPSSSSSPGVAVITQCSFYTTTFTESLWVLEGAVLR